MATNYSTRKYTNEDLLHALFDYLGVCIVDNELYPNTSYSDNPIKIEKVKPIAIYSIPSESVKVIKQLREKTDA
jgi:hypothetical protein